MKSASHKETDGSPLNVALELFLRLADAEIPHCHWKSNEHLAAALAGKTDIDLLVAKEHAGECEKILEKLGYKRVVSEGAYPDIEEWFGLDTATTELVHIHLHYRIVTGLLYVKEQRLPWEQEILKTAVKDGQFGVCITNPNLELLLLVVRIGFKTRLRDFIRALCGKDVLDDDFKRELSYLLDQAEGEHFDTYAKNMLGTETGNAVAEILHTGAIETGRGVWRLRKLLRRELRAYRRYARTTTVAKYLMTAVKRKIRVHAAKYGVAASAPSGKRFPNGGKVVAFIGPDGSGKSTATTELCKWLSWKFAARKMYLGTGEDATDFFSVLYRRLMKRSRNPRISNRTPTNNIQEKATGGHRRALPYWRRIVHAFFICQSARERLKKVRRARRLANRGAIVLADWYPQNQFRGVYGGPRLQPSSSAFQAPSFFRTREQKAFEQMAALPPDIVFKFNISTEKALERKSDSSRRNVEEKVRITPRITFPGARVVEIDATLPLDEVQKTIRRTLWEEL